MTATPLTTTTPSTDDGVISDRLSGIERAIIIAFITVPLLAVIAAIPVAWGGWLSWTDAILAVTFYIFAGLGITVGFHRLFTHSAFKASRSLRIVLAVAGSMALQGPVIRWVADHRKHHSFSDQEGDPHSPWKYGKRKRDIAKGLAWAHILWLFDEEQTPHQKYAPDLMKDRDMVWISQKFMHIGAVSLLLPAVLGGLITRSWMGALTALFWAGLVRIALLHHVTWSINSICHVWGKRPFVTRDRSGNVAWLALLSFGESWHNLHHSEPTAARHGVLRFQIDPSARIIRWFEQLGWARDVRWPRVERLATKRAPVDAA